MTVLRMCDLGHVSRAGLYRYDVKAETPEDDLDLRDEIQKISLEFPYYGRPRITAELQRRGWEVNHKRVGRIMREDNLLCLRRRKFVVTTDSNHSFRVYANTAKDMKLTGIDQLWRTHRRGDDQSVHRNPTVGRRRRVVQDYGTHQALSRL